MDGERLHPESVSVELSGCSKGGRPDRVRRPCTCFSSDRRSDEVPRDYHRGAPHRRGSAPSTWPRPGAEVRPRPAQGVRGGRRAGRLLGDRALPYHPGLLLHQCTT